MNQYTSFQQSQGPYGQSRSGFGFGTNEIADRSVFGFFNMVYAWMAVALAVTALVAYYAGTTGMVFKLGIGGLIACGLGAFVLAMVVQSMIGRMSAVTATALLLLYAALDGVMVSYIFLVYKHATIVSAFFLTAGVFAGMSVYGFITKRDLTGIGSTAVMLAFGLFIASIVNIFLGSSMLSWFITYAILVIFVIITAYKTQELKHMAMEFQGNPGMLARIAPVGSLVLHITFMNLFISILRILNDRD